MEATKRERRREEEPKEEAIPESFELPPEIIREILIRLPAKSIGRFRCVSKLFCSLSTDPGFAKSQLDLTISRPVNRKMIVSSHNLYASELDSIGEGSQGRIIREDLVGVELNYPLKDEPSVFNEILKRYVRDYLYCGGSDVDEADRRAMLKLTSKSHRRRNWVEMVGSSYGLLCISPGEGALFLYNPTTGESKSLPGITPTQFDEHGDQFQTYGFGYDHLTRDYKVVKLVADFDNLLYASVYSLKSGLWRRIRDLSYEHNDGFNAGVYLNGALHWVFTLLQANHRVVLAFDIQTEEFRDMPLPAEAEDCPHRFKNFVVGNLNGRLCVVNSCFELHDDVWVMKEYGVVSSWTRIRISLLYRSMKPLCSTKNTDEVLLEVDGDMVLYNLETDASRNLGIRGVKLSDGFEANTYVESIISPNSFGVERTEDNALVI